MKTPNFQILRRTQKASCLIAIGFFVFIGSSTVCFGQTCNDNNLLAEWSLDACWLTNCCETDPWNEFDPTFLGNFSCGNVTGMNLTKVKRTNVSVANTNRHSCSIGQQGTGICLSGDDGSTINWNSDRVVSFTAIFPAGYDLTSAFTKTYYTL